MERVVRESHRTAPNCAAYEFMTSIPSMPMARPIDAPKMCPMKMNGKRRQYSPKDAITLRLATTMQSTGSTSAAFVRGSASLPSPPTVVNARRTTVTRTENATGRHISIGGKSSIANSVIGCDCVIHESTSSGCAACGSRRSMVVSGCRA